MDKKVYRMKVIDIIGWGFYILLTRAFFAALIFLIGSIFFLVFGLDQSLHIGFITVLKIYLVLFLVFILNKITNKVIYIALDNSKIVLRNLYKSYEFSWQEIRTINEVKKKPGFIGISSHESYSYGNDIYQPMARKILMIETNLKKFNIELTEDSFGIHTIQLPVDLNNYKEGKGRTIEEQVAHVERITISSRKDALQFFKNRIIKEAEINGITLSDPDLEKLGISVEDQNINPELIKRIEDDFTQGSSEFEEKITHLLKSVYDREVSSSFDSISKETVRNNYRDAYCILKKRDNYINIMLEKALAGDLEKGLRRFIR